MKYRCINPHCLKFDIIIDINRVRTFIMNDKLVSDATCEVCQCTLENCDNDNELPSGGLRIGSSNPYIGGNYGR